MYDLISPLEASCNCVTLSFIFDAYVRVTRVIRFRLFVDAGGSVPVKS